VVAGKVVNRSLVIRWWF